jgi:hypothetical protein
MRAAVFVGVDQPLSIENVKPTAPGRGMSWWRSPRAASVTPTFP